MTEPSPLDRARISHEGLSVGDAFGERLFSIPTPLRGRKEIMPSL
jgi:hypothetical protein